MHPQNKYRRNGRPGRPRSVILYSVGLFVSQICSITFGTVGLGDKDYNKSLAKPTYIGQAVPATSSNLSLVERATTCTEPLTCIRQYAWLSPLRQAPFQPSPALRSEDRRRLTPLSTRETSEPGCCLAVCARSRFHRFTG